MTYLSGPGLKPQVDRANELIANRKSTGCFFNDGERKVDYVLVWEEKNTANQDSNTQQSGEVENAVYRRKFQSSLMLAGLQLEEEMTVADKKTIHFLKLYVTWEAMCYWAENLKMRAPMLPVVEPQLTGFTAKLKSMLQQVPKQPMQFYTCPFVASQVQRYFGIEHGDAFFTSSQRSMVAREILCTQVYGEAQHFEIGVDRMIDAGILASAFPLHEGPCEEVPMQIHAGQTDAQDPLRPVWTQPRGLSNPRWILRTYWASWSQWFSYQPLNHVQEYFGEKIAFYFAWLGVYTEWLSAVALVGFFVFIYGLCTMNQDVPSQEACSSGSQLKMCPVCDDRTVCHVWLLSEVCSRIRLANMLDHGWAVYYSGWMSIAALLLFEQWRRQCNVLRHRWGVANYRPESAPLLSGYATRCKELRPNPVTQAMEPHCSPIWRLPRFIFSAFCTIIMVTFVAVFLLLMILCQTSMSSFLFRTPETRQSAKLTANCVASILQLLIMIFMEKVFQNMAYKLTKWEFHKTQSEFDNHLAVKMFIFEVTNYYSWIFYIAFFKGRFGGYPGNYETMIGFRQEQCDEGSCLFDLGISLFIIMTGRTLIAVIAETCGPKLQAMSHRRQVSLSPHPAKPWEADYCLPPQRSLFLRYRELTLQFGFISLFAAAFPLAPLLALLKNSFALRLDARRFVVGSRRSAAERARGIGVWLRLLEVLAAASVITNGFFIAFTSEFVPRQLYGRHIGNFSLLGFTNFSLAWAPPNTTAEPCRYRDYRNPDGKNSEFYWKLLVAQLAFVIVFVHVVFFVRHLVIVLVPELPSKVQLKIDREDYLDRHGHDYMDPVPQTRLWEQLQQQRQQQPQQRELDSEVP